MCLVDEKTLERKTVGGQYLPVPERVVDVTGGADGGADGNAALRLRHDLRQPLTAMRLIVEAMTSTGGLPPDVVAGLRQIQHEAEWMSRLVSGTEEDRRTVAVVDLADTVADACSTAPPTAAYQ